MRTAHSLTTIRPIVAGLMAVFLVACSSELEPQSPVATADPVEAERVRQLALEAGLLPLNQDAPLLLDEQLVALGETLFFDPLLAGEQDVACSTCHHPSLAFADGRDFPIGVGGVGLGPERAYAQGAHDRVLGPLRPLGRSSPTIANLSILARQMEKARSMTAFTWDGRFSELATFSHVPLGTRDEMRGDAWPQLSAVEGVLERLNEHPAYRERFENVYGLSRQEPIDDLHLERAISSFMLSINSPPNELDRLLDGDLDTDASFVRGLELFVELGCSNCHRGEAMSDALFHRTGVPFGDLTRPLAGGFDVGHMEFTGRESDRYRFRTAPLREIAHTAPYMHNGTLHTLRDVIQFYTGGENPLAGAPVPVGDDEIERGTPRALSGAEVNDLERFLIGLSSAPGELESLYPGPQTVLSGLAPSALLPTSTE